MRLRDLEHIIRAASSITEDEDIVVFGSQAILGSYPSAPDAMLVSDEADIFPRNHPERTDLIDGVIGELSPFHETFGYYAQAVGPETATLPKGWEKRLVALTTPATRGATGWCLDPHDLCVAKLIAGREKDLDYVRVALDHSIVSLDLLHERLADTEAPKNRRERVAGWLRARHP